MRSMRNSAVLIRQLGREHKGAKELLELLPRSCLCKGCEVDIDSVDPATFLPGYLHDLHVLLCPVKNFILSKTYVSQPFDQKDFFFCADTHDFFAYRGSLTTPPLFESVQWVNFLKPIEFSEGQVRTSLL